MGEIDVKLSVSESISLLINSNNMNANLILRDIVENTPLPIAVFTGKELVVELANAAMIKAWGKGSEIIGRKYLEVLPEIKDDVFFDQAIGVLSTGVPFHGKNKKTDLIIDGELKTYYYNYSYIPLIDSNGAIYAVMNTGVDVTDLYLANKQVLSAEERLRIAIDSAGMGTYEIDLSTNKVKTCGSFKSIFSNSEGKTRENLIGRLHPDDLPIREQAYINSKKTELITYEARIFTSDHDYKWVRINGKIIRDENQNPATIIGTIQDIHETKKFEDELKKQVSENTEELRRSNDDLMHFASVVSHDLREPVRKIKIFNGLIQNEKDANFSDNTKKYLKKIDQSAQRMTGIIEGILSYSSLDKKKQPIEKIDLNNIIQNITTDLELIIKEKKAAVVTSALPEIEGAAILINQLFFNLLHNALKFSKPGELPHVAISHQFTTMEDREAVEITIKDNGIGLDEAYAERIFKSFERLHSKDEYEGNGLGLALCRKIVTRHLGTIIAKGEQNQGAEFIIVLPLRQKDKFL
jgi:PAS domain S-box-containing protein